MSQWLRVDSGPGFRCSVESLTISIHKNTFIANKTDLIFITGIRGRKVFVMCKIVHIP